FLIDPVFSNRASPVPGFNKPFAGTNIYKAEEMPEIDFLIITHDHYDHLDYETILKLKPKIKKVFTPLGVGGHFERWGYDMAIVSEKDWGEEEIIGENSKITFTTSRHFSGRSFNRNNTLWGSYVLEINGKKIFIGGDSGYGKHFKEIGEKYGPFDFAFLENGQYNESWPEHHSMPEQVVQEAKELNTKNMIPVHSGKFRLSNHKWYEPLEKISELSKTESYNLLTPMIGEKVDLDAKEFKFEKWWKKVK
ncbi:MBL fold metallo-hydrolase, partial [Candidatus Gracilibacteria bacterium GN02-872]